jgi:hypothetical protein
LTAGDFYHNFECGHKKLVGSSRELHKTSHKKELLYQRYDAILALISCQTLKCCNSMFCRREKQIFPPGTFIATPARVAAIIQLCLAFTLLLWIVAQPFTADLFAIKLEMLRYDELRAKPLLMEKVPAALKQQIAHNYSHLEKKLQTGFADKLQASLWLFFRTPPFELAWMFFSLLLPIMLLMRIEGAATACCLLPIIALAFAIDNHLNAQALLPPPDQALFPSESYLVQNYLDAPLSASTLAQQQELRGGWQRYLIVVWGKEIPSSQPKVYLQQLEEAEFAFNLARLQLRLKAKTKVLASELPPARQSHWTLWLYILWNVFFAGVAIGKQEERLMPASL